MISMARMICRLGALGGVCFLSLLFLLGLAEILSRGLFDNSLSFAHEYAGYLTALSLFWGAGYGLLEGSHVRMSLLDDALSPKGRKTLDQIANLLGLFISLLLTVALITWAYTSYLDQEVSFYASATPLWLPQVMMAYGPLTLMAAFIIRLKGDAA